MWLCSIRVTVTRAFGWGLTRHEGQARVVSAWNGERIGGRLTGDEDRAEDWAGELGGAVYEDLGAKVPKGDEEAEEGHVVQPAEENKVSGGE